MGSCLHCCVNTEDILHCFFGFTNNLVTRLTLLSWVTQLVPEFSPESALIIDLQQQQSEYEELAVVCTLEAGLKYIVEARVAKKLVESHKIRAEVEASISILRRSRFYEAGPVMENMLN